MSFGIIPMSTRERTLWPQETFDIHDDTLVSIELVSAEVNVTQPSEISLYLKTFEQLRGMAVYGAEARALILRAIEAWTEVTPTRRERSPEPGPSGPWTSCRR